MSDILQRNADRLELHIEGQNPLYTDFSRHIWQHRRDAGKSQILFQAVKPKPGMVIIDATAGWGRDAAVLASFGAQVIMLERNPIMAALLQDGINRQSPHDKKTLKLTLIHIDAIEYLTKLQHANFPDLIYIDPMHPERKTGLKVKKDLQILQKLIGVDQDAGELLRIARTIAPVIVKWPLQSKDLAPDVLHTWRGKTIRMDKFIKSN